MNAKLFTLALLFFLILCIAATWGKVKEWFWSISTGWQYFFILLAYGFFELILYNFNPLYPLYFWLLTCAALMAFFIYGIYKVLLEFYDKTF
jgi:uncharacterized membrane protein